MKKGKLAYNSKNDRYGILVMDLWEDDGLHCGETFEVLINGEWYLVYSKLRGSELEYLPVRRK